MTFHAIGTGSVANGTTTITFAGAMLGTKDEPAIKVGDLFLDPAQPLIPGQRLADIDYVAGTAELWVGWPGTTMAAAPYEVRFVEDGARSTAQTRRYLERLGQLADLGLQPNAFGDFADRAAFDGQAKGYIFLSLNGDGVTGGWTVYIKQTATPGDWDAGQPIQGPPGQQGSAGLVADWKGPWAPGAYDALDGVSFGGASYIAKVATANAPPHADWDLVAAKGDPGANGTNGVGITPASSAGPAQLDLAEDTDNGTSKVSLKAPASLAADRAFILPDADVTLSAFIASLLNSTTLTGAQTAIGVRTVLAADQVFYVGYNMGAVSISIATPGVVTKVAHGLVANDRVSFSILPNHKPATLSVGTPAVITMANTFAAGQPFKLSTTGRLATGVTAGTTYYVLAAGLTAASFQFSATPGGAPISTTAPVVTISNASPGVVTLNAHGLTVGDPVMFATTGALPAGLTAGVVYFVKTVPNANTFTVSATPEGAAINTSSAGTGTHTLVQHGSHLLAETGTLPTGVTEGQDYHVLAAGLTADTFRFSATSGGAAINTTGAATGTISMKTGSDSHDGKANTAAGAFLTLQKAMDVISDTLDLGSFNAAVVIADGMYLGGVALRAYVGRGAVTFLGNAAYPGNSALNTAGNCFNGYFCGGRWTIKDMELRAAGNGMNLDGPGNIQFSNLRFGPCSNAHVRGTQGAQLDAIGDYSVVGGGGFHLLTGWLATITVNSRAVTFYGAAFSVSTAYADSLSLIQLISTTFPGAATVTGKRYTIGVNAAINIAGSPAGEAYIPGSIAGSKGPGGQYN